MSASCFTRSPRGASTPRPAPRREASARPGQAIRAGRGAGRLELAFELLDVVRLGLVVEAAPRGLQEDASPGDERAQALELGQRCPDALRHPPARLLDV
jgi:hypothetical protein